MTRSSVAWVIIGVAVLGGGAWLAIRSSSDEPASVVSAGRDDVARRSPFAAPGAKTREQPAGEPPLTRAPSAAGTAAGSDSPLKADSVFARRQALYAVADRADRKQLDALIGEARELSNADERRSALEILLLRYAELDPDEALRHASEIGGADAAHLFGTIAHVEPLGAWERATKVADPVARRAYQGAVASAWAQREPERVFAVIAALPPDWQRKDLLHQVTIQLARTDPKLAIELTQTVEPISTNSLLDLVAAEWSRQDPSAAAQWVESKPVALQSRFAFRIADAYVAQRPAEALAWALKISRSPGRNLWSYMIGQMALQNPHEALQLAQAAENPAQRAQATGNALGVIAARDPALALNYLQKLPAGGGLRSNVLSQLAAGLAESSPVAALDWVERIEDQRTRLDLAHHLSNALANRDVEAAAQLIDRVPKEVRSAWISNVASAYAQTDVEKGRQWVQKYDEESRGLTQQFARTIAARSPELALQLIDDVANDDERDQLLSGMLPTVAMQSPETAARWAENLASSPSRSRAIASVAGVWAAYDPTAARKWLLSVGDRSARDAGFAQMLLNTSSADDALALVGQIQSPEQRMHAVASAAMRLARHDPDGARALTRRYPLDPQRQQQVDSYLRQFGKGE